MSALDRAAALRGLRPVRSGSQPPVAVEPQAEHPPQDAQSPALDQPYAEAQLEDGFSYQALVEDPVRVCRSMSASRIEQPARPLNVDLTPETARSFDELCRRLRVKKKDVVEVLLRGWMSDTDLPR